MDGIWVFSVGRGALLAKTDRKTWGSPQTFGSSPSHLPLQHSTRAPGTERSDEADQAGSSACGLAIPKIYPFAL